MSDVNILKNKIDRMPSLTLFQKKVYKAILDIPRGDVRSYKWVAEKAGVPKAYRAVGNALNRNPYYPEVPCHRVICSNGNIGGYVGGVKKKLAILRKEGVLLKKMKREKRGIEKAFGYKLSAFRIKSFNMF